MHAYCTSYKVHVRVFSMAITTTTAAQCYMLAVLCI